MLHKAHEVYAAELSSSSGDWLGYPLWCPQPGHLGEAQIGDVGHLSEGRFHRFFNITTKDGEPKPDQFEALDFDVRGVGVDERQGYPEAGTHASKKVTILKAKAGGGVSISGLPGLLETGCEFESTHDRGAILYLEEAGTSKKVFPEALKDWKQYLAQNCTSWAPFIKNTYKITIPPNKLILVTGWVKTSRWEVAAFVHKQSSESIHFRAGMKYLEGRLYFSVDADTGWDWDHASGPSTQLSDKEKHASAEHKAPQSTNQKKSAPKIKAPRRIRERKNAPVVETEAQADDNKHTRTMYAPRRARDKKKAPAAEPKARSTGKNKEAATADTSRSTGVKQDPPTTDTPRRTRRERQKLAAEQKTGAVKDKKPVPATVVPQRSDGVKSANTVKAPRRSRQDQCIFLNFLEIDTWHVVAARLRGGAGSSDESSCEDMGDFDDPDSASSGADNPDAADFMTSEPDSYETVESVSSDVDGDHDILPCASIRKYIRKTSDAEMAIADDNDLKLLLGEDVDTEESGTSTSPNVRVISLANLEDYLNDQQFPVDVDVNKVGTLSPVGLVQHAQVRREKLRWHRLEERIRVETPRRWDNFMFDLPALDVTGGETSQGRDGGLATQQGDIVEDPSEKVVLADGRSFRWLDILFGLRQSTGGGANPSFSILDGGKYIVTYGTTDGVVLWNCLSGDYIRHFSQADEVPPYVVAFSPNEAVLDPLDPPSIATPDDTATIPPSVQGTKFVATYQDSAPIIWSLDGTKLATFREGRGAAFVACSPAGHTIAAALLDEVAYIWTSDGTLLHTLRYHGKTTALAYSPDGTSLLITADASAYLWSCESGTQLVAFRRHTSTIRAARISYEGEQVVTGSDDCTLRVWDARTGEEVFKMKHETGVLAVDFSPDDRTISSGCVDGSIVVISNSDERWKIIFTTDVKRRSSAVHTLAYSHNGRFIASGDEEGRVKVWMAKDGTFVAEFWGHRKRVKSVLWTPDNRSVVSSSEDGTVRSRSVYDVRRFI